MKTYESSSRVGSVCRRPTCRNDRRMGTQTETGKDEGKYTVRIHFIVMSPLQGQAVPIKA